MKEQNTILDLSKFAKLTSYIIAVVATFSLVHAYFYYCLFLHVPIFQYLELYDLFLMGSSGVFWALWIGASQSATFISNSKHLDKKQRAFYVITLWSFAAFICTVGYRNDPAVREIIIAPLRYWYFWLPPFIIYILITLKSVKEGTNFFKNNRFVAVFVLTIWYGIFNSFVNYQVLVQPDRSLHYKLKLVGGKIIETGNQLKYAGRTRSYWFFYNSKTKEIRAIKNENAEIVDFDSKPL